jgi:hypothetical protein
MDNQDIQKRPRGRPKGTSIPDKTFYCEYCDKTLSFNSKTAHNNSSKHQLVIAMHENIKGNINNIIKTMLSKKSVV